MKKRLLLQLAVLFLICSSMITACTQRYVPIPTSNKIADMEAAIHTLEQVPGITEDEIQAIQALKDTYDQFVFGIPLSTEAFFDEQGNIDGFTRLLCEWLSDVIGIPFTAVNVEFNDIFNALEDGTIDFAGGLAPSEERKLKYHMTDPIIERTLVYYRLVGSRPLYEILETRPLKLALLQGSATTDLAIKALGDTNFEAIYVDYNKDVIPLLLEGQIDGFVHQNTTRTVFEGEPRIITKDFYPPTFTSVSITALRDTLQPVIEVIQKSLTYNQRLFLNNIYRKGELIYQKKSFRSNLTEEELTFLSSITYVPFAAEFSNYPISFYDRHNQSWSGIVMDVLQEISTISDIEFRVVNQVDDDWTTLLSMLKGGEAWMISELIQTEDREGHFLWADTIINRSTPALISSASKHHINLNDILYAKIGIVDNSAYEELMRAWFPNATNLVLYNNNDQAINALIHNEVEMIFMNEASLLNITNYRELPDYKVNLSFDQPILSTFGFNKEQELLQSVVSKALTYVDVQGITTRWMNITFDYRLKVAEAQTPWVISSTILIVIVFILVIFFMHRRQVESVKLSAFQRSVISTFADLIESRDTTTGKHISNVRKYFICMVEKCKELHVYSKEISLWNTDTLSFAAELHDVGKIGISDIILNKPGKLTAHEFSIMKTHTTLGVDVLEHMEVNFKNNELLESAKRFAVSHHEKWDGTGYPYGLKGEEIPLEGRILAIVDVYDALVSERPYKRAFSAQEAADIITEECGTQFDPQLVEVFKLVQEQFEEIARD